MFAVVQVGGRQYRVSPGDEIVVEKLKADQGSNVSLPVLLWSDDAGVTVGKPTIAGKEVAAKVLGDEKGEKIIVFRYTPKKRYRRKTGHRQTYTRLRIIGDGVEPTQAKTTPTRVVEAEPAAVDASAATAAQTE